jgi:hypothetical protein
MATASDAILVLLAELDRSTQPPDAVEAFRQLLLQKMTDLMTEGERRVHFARHLLGLGTPRSMIRARLEVRYNVGRTQAYRDIEQALQLSLPNGTKERFTDIFQ